MRKLRRLSPLQGRLLLALFACAVLVRAFVPVGWMPVAGADGVRLVLCSGMGPMAAKPSVAAMPMHHAMPGMDHPAGNQDDAGHGNPGADHPCAFAGVTPGIEGPAMSVPPAIAVMLAAPALVRALVTIGNGLAAPPPPQTGPPAFA